MPKSDFLKEVVLKKKEKLALVKQSLPLETLKEKVAQSPPVRPFIEAIHKPRVISLIAEIKKSSPSRGLIRQDFNHLEIARSYSEAQVQAISVLTEEDYFGGNIVFLNEVRSVSNIPLLRKDFIIDSYQVYEARYFGADAILLIADLLTKDQLSEYMHIAQSLNLDCLVEVHTERELKKVLGMKVGLIGINNRDLRTFEVDLKTTERLFPMIPKETVVVVESGIKSRQDVLFLKILGVSAVLVGEAFMDALDVRRKIEEIMGW
jgi:indole-3-glycerol phosphate synthase